jgi:hypothetical protein
MSKDEGGRNSSLSEKPVRSRPRRLVDWINPTGAKKVHSLIDKVYKRKNLEMAWEKVKENRGSGETSASCEARSAPAPYPAAALWFEVIICLILRPWILNLYRAASSGFVFEAS